MQLPILTTPEDLLTYCRVIVWGRPKRGPREVRRTQRFNETAYRGDPHG
jgi:hypothetical protein